MMDAITGVVVPLTIWIADKLFEIESEGESILEAKRQRVADYFLEIAECLSKVASELSDRQIPTEYGNYLESLVDGLDLVIASNLCGRYEIRPDDKADWLHLLKDALRHADDADGAIMFANSDASIGQVSIEHHVRSIKRTAGIFRGISQRIRALGVKTK